MADSFEQQDPDFFEDEYDFDVFDNKKQKNSTEIETRNFRPNNFAEKTHPQNSNKNFEDSELYNPYGTKFWSDSMKMR